ncbi:MULTISPECIES: Tat pathway signal sequence domain protein [unclassified Streptomyces]|uniref:phage baseplate protein n=1 Tax=unclassified Streptomyces TaxID=2593676 RepID=UPI0038147CBE
MSETSPVLSRRQLIKWTGGALGVTALGSAAVALSGGTASAVSASARFDLTDASDELFREIWLQETRVLQSFSFDNTNKHLYAVGLVQGGRQLPGESRAYTGTEREANGDLCVTRLDLTGAIIGRMYLKGFGHGVSIAAEPSGNSAYLWTETDSVQALDSATGQYIGWGTRLARFKFANGAVLTPTSPQLTKYSPVAGADRTTIAIDPVNSRLAVRHRPGSTGSTFKYNLYDLATFTAGTFTPLATMTQPAGLGTFQGFTSLGQYLYLIDGNSYSDSNPSPGNTYITSVDWNTGTTKQRELTKAGTSLLFREPEGLAIQIPNTADTTKCRLVMGFASSASDTDSNRKASFYYKDSLV